MLLTGDLKVVVLCSFYFFLNKIMQIFFMLFELISSLKNTSGVFFLQRIGDSRMPKEAQVPHYYSSTNC